MPDAATKWTRRHLLGLEELPRAEIVHLLDLAERLSNISTHSKRNMPALMGRTIVNMFYENSTRTSLSFQLSAQRLSADVLFFSKAGTSVAKGESLVDTAKNIEAMGVDALVLRHPAAGAAALLARHVGCSVVNAGDGQHEHPTQALLDLYTIRHEFARRERPRDVSELTVGIVGDIQHSRVARSNIWGLTRLGAKVLVVGPTTMAPDSFAALGDGGVEVCHDLDEAIERCDVLNMLRIQFERQAGAFPPLAEYIELFGLTAGRLRRGRPDLMVMHPGPVNRGIEVSPEVADGPQSVILRQVANGLAVRMAVLLSVVGAKEAEENVPPAARAEA